MELDIPPLKAESWCQDIARWAEHLPLMAACFDAQSRLLYCNTAYANWLGQSAEALRGQPLEQMVSAAAMQSIAPQVASVLRGQITQYERQSHLVGPHGDAWLQVRLVPFPSDEQGVVPGYFCFMQDTTRLHASDSSLDLLRTSPGLTIWELDLQTGQLHAEQNWLDEARRHEPKTFTIPEWMGHVVPADLPALEQAIARISAPDGFVQTVETRFIRADGQMVTTIVGADRKLSRF